VPDAAGVPESNPVLESDNPGGSPLSATPDTPVADHVNGAVNPPPTALN
jgi:hypothetical protein